MVEAVNPQTGAAYFSIPVFLGFATETGPNSPNGALIFGSLEPGPLATSPFGVVVWYNE
jgi:hypothetical protein